MAWTRFMDMYSGGGQKEDFAYCYIEAPESEARLIFFNRFEHNPGRVTCTCCGEDYSIDGGKTLEQLTRYDRGCAHRTDQDTYIEEQHTDSYRRETYCTLNQFRTDRKDCLFISASDIKDAERVGNVPKQGFVWVD